MLKKKRKEEEALIASIESFKGDFIAALQNKLVLERDERHKNGEVFFEGYWVPKDLVPKLQQKLSKNARIVFFEVHLLALGVVLFGILLWIVFRIFLLP